MEKKKGQASMEFLMTYGWAILAAVLAISVLAYYGVFSPGKSLPNICLINNPLGCDEYQVNTTGVRIILRNGAGDSLNVTNFSVSGCGSTTTVDVVEDGGTENIFIACTLNTSALTVGSKFNGNIDITYLRAGKTISETTTGDVRAEIV